MPGRTGAGRPLPTEDAAPPGGTDGPQLRRRLSLPLVVLYGLGTTIGAGIYVLVGRVAGTAGLPAPWAFLLAGALAALTAGSFGELASRYPTSAGEAAYVGAGFGVRWVSTAVGLLVCAAGIVSSAAIATGFVGYLAELVEVPGALGTVALVVGLTAVAVWGIGESVGIASAITLLEVGGLLFVLAGGAPVLAELPDRWPALMPPLSAAGWGGVAAGATLAFYAFLGFEDIVNVAEEVTDAPRLVPRAIVVTLVLSTALYVAVASLAVLAVPVPELAASDAPLALVSERVLLREPRVISAIAIVAVMNGALIQIIMASRVVYGLASRGQLPGGLARIAPRTRTPWIATWTVGGLVLALALAFPLERLAETTSYVTLVVFTLVNAALWRIHRQPDRPPAAFEVPRWVPIGGALATAGFLVSRGMAALP